MLKIVFLDTATMGNVPNLKDLNQFGNVIYYDLTSPEETIERLKDANIAITCKVVINKNIIDSCRMLNMICAAATGVNHIDVEYANSKGIIVKNVAGYSTNSVAQATFSLILELTNHISYYDNYVKSGEYSKNRMFTHMGPTIIELHGKTLGIIGLGAIGQKVALIGKSFGMNVCYYSTSGKNYNNKYRRIELDELLRNSDIISIHAPLNDNTRNLITLKELREMKPTAFLINAGRGGIINENDLAQALDDNIIAGAGIDVFSKEPIETTNPLMNIKNKSKIVFSPHSAWTSLEARIELIKGIVKNIKEFVDNKKVNA